MSDNQKWMGLLDQNHMVVIRLKKLLTFITTGWRRGLMVAFLILLSTAIIIRIIVDNWQLLLDYDWSFRPGWLVTALVLFSIDLFLSLYVWHLLVSKLAHYKNLRLNIKFVLQSNLARRLPGTVWYVASRALLYQEEGVSKKATSLISALELAMFIVSGTSVTLLTLPLWLGRTEIENVDKLAWIVLAIFPASLVLVHPKIIEKIWTRLNKQKLAQTLRWNDTVLWLLLYMGTWVLGGGVVFSIINIFQSMPMSDYVTITGMWAAASTISLIGFVALPIFSLREVTLVFLLNQLLPLPIALIIAVAVRVLWLSGELIASVVALRL